MNDRELLELAAKAAGIPFILDKDGTMWFADPWSPLTDDGDALRLAVKLRFEIDIRHTGIAIRIPSGILIWASSEEALDAYKAARRAIVMAAAEIGKETHDNTTRSSAASGRQHA